MLALGGLEVEYAAVLSGAPRGQVDPRALSRLIVAQHQTVLAALDVQTYGSPYDGMLSNGARLYDDLGHPEYATPECREVATLVACQSAGDRLMAACGRAVASDLPAGARLALLKNNINHAGCTWGCHENYLVSPALFEELTQGRGVHFYEALVPFLVTRSVFAGAGRPGGNDGMVGYQLAQRADFVHSLLGLETTYDRPIVNTRDEPLADRHRYRRLHLVLGDANMSEYTTFLKVGTTRLILRMLEEDGWQSDLALAEPVSALRQVSRDPLTGLALSNGKRLRAADLQSECLEQAAAFLAREGGSPEEQSVLVEWENVLKALPSDLATAFGRGEAAGGLLLGDRLDWAIKLVLLDGLRLDAKLGWDASELKELDLRYHDICIECGLFFALQSHGLVQRPFVDDGQVAHYQIHPPDNTRARIRVEAMREHADSLMRVDWDRLITTDGMYLWPDPVAT